MSSRTALLTSVTLVFFASNSILCRLALEPGMIDAGLFTCVRLLSGTLVLMGLLTVHNGSLPSLNTRWKAAVALFAYAASFSFAYLHIPAGIGALVLFGAVQLTMIGWDAFLGRRPRGVEVFGALLAMSGLAVLAVPGTTAVNTHGIVLMGAAGVAWGVYSLSGRTIADPLRATTGNFAGSLVLAAPLALWTFGDWTITAPGLVLAIVSGGLASGLGYVIWYAALRGLSATQAGIVQLLVPIAAVLGGMLILNEPFTARLAASGTLVLGGVTLAMLRGGRSSSG